MNTLDWLLPWRAKRKISELTEYNRQLIRNNSSKVEHEVQALTDRAEMAEQQLKAEQVKIRALARWIKVAHRLDSVETEKTIKRVLQQNVARSQVLFVMAMLMMTGIAKAQLPPILRNFFDTNPAPIVDVVAGAGINVTPSTPNVQTRRFTVIATGSTVASNVYGSNVIGSVQEASHSTNADNWIGSDSLSNQIYLSITNLNVYTSNALQQSMSNTVGYVSNILTGADTALSNQIHLDLTNLNTFTSNSLQQSMSNTVDYVSNILVLGSIAGSNQMHLDLTNLNTFTSNALQQSMSNTVGYVSNILTGADIALSNQIHLDLTNLNTFTSNALSQANSNLYVLQINGISTNQLLTNATAWGVGKAGIVLHGGWLSTNDTTGSISTMSNASTMWSNGAAAGSVDITNAGGYMVFDTFVSGNEYQFKTSGLVVMAISNGMVGIQKSNPTKTLDVNGNINALNEITSSSSYIQANQNVAMGTFFNAASSSRMYASSNGQWRFTDSSQNGAHLLLPQSFLDFTSSENTTNTDIYSLGTNLMISDSVVIPFGKNYYGSGSGLTNLNLIDATNYANSLGTFAQNWYVWGSSNSPGATNAAGLPYKVMQRSDVTMNPVANTNTYASPADGTYIAEVITAIPMGVTEIRQGTFLRGFYAFTSGTSLQVTPEIYIRTNLYSTTFTVFGEREIAAGTAQTINTTPQAYLVSVPLSSNVTCYATNYLVMKLKISNRVGTPNVSLVSQDNFPAYLSVPLQSADFVLRAGDTMSGNLIMGFGGQYIGDGAGLTNIAQKNQYTTNFFRGFVVEALGVSKGDVLCEQGAGFGVQNGDTFVALAKNNDVSLLPVIGVAGENAAFNTYVTVVKVGDVSFDTSAFTDGDYAYLSNNGKIGVYPTDPNAVAVRIGQVSRGANPGILRVNIHPRFDSISVWDPKGGDLQYDLWNGLTTGFSGSYFVARNTASKAMYGINDANASPNPNSQVINNSGIPILFQIASNTAVTISTASNLSVGWFGQFSGNGLGLTNLSATNNNLYSWANLTTNAYQSVWIDAGAMATNATGGPTIGYCTSTNFDGIYSDVWKFDSSTPQTNYFKLMLPDSWDLGTVKVKFFYFTTAVVASTSNVWAVCAQAVSKGDLYGFRGTEVSVTNLVQDTTNKLNVCTSPAITVGGTPALGDMVHFQIRRVADSGWDNSSGDAWLLGVAIQYQDKRNNPAVW